MFNINQLKHPTSHLNWSWKCIVIGTVSLPLFPNLGALSFVVALINICLKEYKKLWRHPLTWSWGIFSIWLIITSCLAYKPSEAFLGLANFLPFMALFIAFRWVIRELEQLFLLAWLLIYSSIPIVILGLSQLYLGWYSPHFLPPLIGWTLRINGVPEGRMSSVFIYANLLAIYLLISLILSIGLWIHSYQNHRRIRKKKLNLQLVFLTITIIFNLIGLILTNSRNGWAIAILACITFAIYLTWYWFVGIVMIIITAISWASFGNLPGQYLMRKIVPDYFWVRLSDQMYANRYGPTLRTSQWNFCWQMTADRPFFGWGLRNFSPLYEQKTNIYLGHPHNLFLMFSAETGIFGVLCLSSIIGWIFFTAIKALHKLAKINKKQDHLILFTYLIALTACVLFNCLDVSLFDFRINTITWLLLACISGVSEGIVDNIKVKYSI